MQIAIKIDDTGVKDALNDYLAKSKNLTPAMKIIGETVRTSIVKNFEQGGRPAKWTPSKKSSGMTLIKSARLMKSITANAYPDRAEIGTNVIYAAIHQLGGKAGRGKKTTISARPFLAVQDEDWPEITKAVNNYLLERFKK